MPGLPGQLTESNPVLTAFHRQCAVAGIDAL